MYENQKLGVSGNLIVDTSLLHICEAIVEGEKDTEYEASECKCMRCK